MNKSSKITTRQITIIGMLSAITIVLGATGIGFIPIPPIKATILHIPVIIGALLEGPIIGLIVGFIFGIFSIVQAVTAPTPGSFVFINPLVSVLPRILIPITTYYTYKLLKTRYKNFNMAVSIFIGSITNTIGVLGMIYLIYIGPYSAAFGISIDACKKALALVVVTNGIPEAIISIIITLAVVNAVNKIRKK